MGYSSKLSDLDRWEQEHAPQSVGAFRDMPQPQQATPWQPSGMSGAPFAFGGKNAMPNDAAFRAQSRQAMVDMGKGGSQEMLNLPEEVANVFGGNMYNKFNYAPQNEASTLGAIGADLGSFFIPELGGVGLLKMMKYIPGVKNALGLAEQYVKAKPLVNSLLKAGKLGGMGSFFQRVKAPESEVGDIAEAGAIPAGLSLLSSSLTNANPVARGLALMAASGGAGYHYGGWPGALAGTTLGMQLPKFASEAGIGNRPVSYEMMGGVADMSPDKIRRAQHRYNAGREIGDLPTPAEVFRDPEMAARQGEIMHTKEGLKAMTHYGDLRRDAQQNAMNDLLNNVWLSTPENQNMLSNLYKQAYRQKLPWKVTEGLYDDPVMRQARERVMSSPTLNRDLHLNPKTADLPQIEVQFDTDDPTEHRTMRVHRPKGGGDSYASDRVESSIDPERKRVQTFSAQVDKPGMGSGKELYKQAIQVANDHGYPYYSDKLLSPAAYNTYKSLEKEGYRVVENPTIIRTDNPHSYNRTEDGGPVLRIYPPKGKTYKKPVGRESYQYVDQMKRALDDLYETSKRSGANNDARIYDEARKELLRAADQYEGTEEFGRKGPYAQARELAQRSIIRRNLEEKVDNINSPDGHKYFMKLLNTEAKRDALLEDFENIPAARKSLVNMIQAWDNLTEYPTVRQAGAMAAKHTSLDRNTMQKFLTEFKNLFGAPRDVEKARFIHSDWFKKGVKEVMQYRDKMVRREKLGDLIAKGLSAGTLSYAKETREKK